MQGKDTRSAESLVTIGIPTYERLPGLLRTIAAARDQTYKNLEILVSDNCSSTYDLVSELAELVAQDHRLNVVRQLRNIGPVGNFTYLCRQARGNYFIWMADDDYCDRHLIEALMQLALSDRRIVLSAADVVVVNDADAELRRERLKSIRASEPWRLARRQFFRYPAPNVFFSIYGLFRIDALRQAVGEMRPAWKHYTTNTEVPFLAKMATQGRIVTIPQALKYYRSHGESVYSKEVRSISRIDQLMIRMMIRVRLVRIAFTAAMPLPEGLMCIFLVLRDALSGELNKLSSLAKESLPLRVRRWLKACFK